jgi:hypothetical protein
MMWRLSDRADAEARVLADVHYSRQKPGAAQFVPPGRALVLKCSGGYWVTSWPFAEWVRHRWAGAWVCSAFHKANSCEGRASDLIRDAVAATLWYREHGGNPKWQADPVPSVWATEAGVNAAMVTFVDPSKIVRRSKYRKPPRDPGRCFLEAGFVPDGTTMGGLPAFVLPLDALPEPAAPLPNSAVAQMTWLAA